MGALGESVVIFGGRNDFNDMLEDTWEFNVANHKWTKINCPNHPVGRSSHTLTVDGQ